MSSYKNRSQKGRIKHLWKIDGLEMAEQYQRRASDRQFPPYFAGELDTTPSNPPGEWERRMTEESE